MLILPTARFSLFVSTNRERGEKTYGAEAHKRICEIVGRFKTADGYPSPDDLKVLQGVKGIDPGEAVLIPLCARNPESVLLTGDKVCMRTLADTTALSEIRSALKGRVYSLERAITAAIDHVGFDVALPRIVAGCSVPRPDTVLRSVFGSGLRTTESAARDGLSHYESELSAIGDGLYYRPV